MQAKEFTEKICNLLVDHKAEDVLSIDVKGKSDVADFFVIASGRSMTHTRALIEHVEEGMEKLGVSPTRREGVREGRWALLDYGDVVVHIFNDESRVFYCLEKLWGNEEAIVKY